ncbi:MAG: HAMP domain-containing sensor histidine kinase [Bacteroidales bacterium]|nr:HAMP domain-containing sensor histidine kinase [Bacteroidales bacterium]
MLFSLSVRAQENGEDMCDSVFYIINSECTDTDKIEKFKNIYFQYRKQDWTKRLFEKSKKDIHWDKKDTSVLELYRIVTMFTDVRKDYPYLNNLFSEIEELSKNTNNYLPYFKVWEKLLSYDIVTDKYEDALSQSKLMEKRAKDVGCKEGMYISQIVLVYLYVKSNKFDKVLEISKENLNGDSISFKSNFIFAINIANSYIRLKDFENAYISLMECENIVNREYNKRTKETRYYFLPNFLYVELLYCNLYKMNKDYTLWNKHLEKAKNYITDNTPTEHYNRYYSSLALYYFETKQWQKSIEINNFLLESADKYRMSKNSVLSIKRNIGRAMFEDGNEKYAAIYMDSLYKETESSYSEILKIQDETIKQNNRMKNALVIREKNKSIFFHLIFWEILLIILVLMYFFYRLLWLRKNIRLNNLLTQDSYKKAEANNKLKETFIKNIRDEIKFPLKSVVDISEILTKNDNPDKELLAVYSYKIKESSEELQKIVNSVLDLSRIESGMMTFSVEKIDLITFIKSVLSEIEGQQKRTIHFITDLNNAYIKTDKNRFKMLLDSLLDGEHEDGDKKIVIGHAKNFVVEEQKLNSEKSPEILFTISIYNSYLYSSHQSKSIGEIQKQINQLIINKFGWRIDIEENKKIVLFIPQEKA